MSEDLLALISRCRIAGSILPLSPAEGNAAREGVAEGLLVASMRSLRWQIVDLRPGGGLRVLAGSQGA